MPKISANTLFINNLEAGIAGKNILRGLDLTIPPNKITVIMGPNGSGKSTLANVLMGHPDYRATKGKAVWQNKNLLKLPSWKRARLGLFLGFQHPVEVPGVNYYEFLLTAHQSIHSEANAQKMFDKNLKKGLKLLKLPESFLERPLNEGFSGGEKKKAEILQLMVLQPRLAVLDETDSGLDIDALKLIAKTIRSLRSPKLGFLVITHYQRLLNYLKPDRIHILSSGRIISSGSASMATKLERYGYDWFNKRK